ncbi:ParB/RepB/Spo0J family partition protein [Burkholderia multivorans]|uniref:ParB/RepB/Spo0J family partition protein n=1 Tax=Burkholderia multivorans TaxID=87883 RepID=UPI000CFEB6CD|nr:ParB/RepB/Spo0J family partition protein [Burkholderia multivorans]MCA8464019.1 ParB/RepB/Spo0J family partition protein [Burkholderia multivorans]MDN7436878.1 ParB/RepB/Spo0J family partition protein [Burkholderia multivorans]PRG14087.1 chromosome partitioning protein ParB [Burkholderia multivorans]
MGKNFGNQLKRGLQRDQAIRSDQVESRFDRVEKVLSGRASLLDDAAAAPREGFDVETLVPEDVKKFETTWPIDKVDDNPLNSRKIYNEEKVKERANSIAKVGQLVPVLAARHPTDSERLILIDGQYRKRARLSLNHKELFVRILENLSQIDFWRLARTANSEREQESVLDSAFGFRKLLDEGLARTEEELATMVGESKSSVNKHLALLDLPEAVIDIMAANPALFGINMAYELTLYRKVVGEAKTVSLVERIVKEQLSFRKVEAIRKSEEAGRRPRNPTARQFKFRRPDGTEVGVIKEWDDGRMQVDLQLGDRVAHFREALQQMLADDGAKTD